MEFWKTAVPAILSPVNHYSIRAKLAVGVGVARTEAGTEAFQNLLREALENHDFCAHAS
jgi:hypothetical protein